MLVPIRMTSNKADRNQQKHLPLDQQATLPGRFHFNKFLSDSFSFSDRCLPQNAIYVIFKYHFLEKFIS